MRTPTSANRFKSGDQVSDGKACLQPAQVKGQAFLLFFVVLVAHNGCDEHAKRNHERQDLIQIHAVENLSLDWFQSPWRHFLQG
nr:hypothetical protein [Schleiferilactobacillus shenzhenensis]